MLKLLLNKKNLLSIASVLAMLFTIAFVISHFNGFIFYWDDYFWFVYIIAMTFLVAYYLPILVSDLIDIHQNNLKEAENQSLEQ
jgi:hypothetical protein|tara:strand:- start:115 stop:366 length:252 start_codon:yes stop_codon:yes gene_type:complete